MASNTKDTKDAVPSESGSVPQPQPQRERDPSQADSTHGSGSGSDTGSGILRGEATLKRGNDGPGRKMASKFLRSSTDSVADMTMATHQLQTIAAATALEEKRKEHGMGSDSNTASPVTARPDSATSVQSLMNDPVDTNQKKTFFPRSRLLPGYAGLSVQTFPGLPSTKSETYLEALEMLSRVSTRSTFCGHWLSLCTVCVHARACVRVRGARTLRL